MSTRDEINTLDDREQAILSELEKQPQGLGFNELYERVKDEMAQKTLQNRLSNLQDQGLIEKEPENPRRGEKVSYKPTEGGYELNQIRQHLEGISQVEVEKFISIIEDWESGEISEDDLLLEINNQYMALPSRVFLIAYCLSFDYADRTRRHILMEAFDICESAHTTIVEYTDQHDTIPDDIKSIFRGCQLYPVPYNPQEDGRIFDNFAIGPTINEP